MISAADITLSFGKRTLFEDVNIQFAPGNCYGLIGANGSGKSTFVKILSGEIEPSSGDVITNPGARISVLKQNHFEFDDFEVLNTVLYGNKRLYDIIIEKDTIYAKPDFSEEDGVKAGDLEAEFAEMNGWDAESQAGELLGGLGIGTKLHTKKMGDLEMADKVKILLAQALFGDPDILLLDEPTNHLDQKSIKWLEDFLYNFSNTVIVVSHDRHFLDNACTHIADIDYSKISVYTGNYSFWYQASNLALQQKRDQNKKTEDKRKDLEDFVKRFSANASKSKQASSRKKLLEKMNVEEIKPSTRKYPHIQFGFEKELGNTVLTVENLCFTLEGEVLIKNFNLVVNKGDKIAFLGDNQLAISKLLQILGGDLKPDSGSIKWGGTVNKAFFPNENTKYFEKDLNLVDWLRQYTDEEEEQFVRGFLGRMLFSGDESQKQCSVLSGGEKVRCMLSRMMLQSANFLIFEDPTAHLDLESITSLNDGMEKYESSLLFASHDHQLIHSVSNRVIELVPKGTIDSFVPYDDYLYDPEVIAKRAKLT